MFDPSRFHWPLVVAMCLIAACDAPPDATPDGVVRAFVEQLAAFKGDARHATRLFEMLSERAKDNLRQRAERYSAASGRKIAPSAMMVPSRFSPGLIRAYSAQLAGKYALVEVVGTPPSRRAKIPCVFENDRWRIDIVMPALAPLQYRPSIDR
jgi:hypothetical protein